MLLLGVIGVGGYFFIKGNNDTSKEIGELKNEVANLGESTKSNTSSSQVPTNIANDTNTNEKVEAFNDSDLKVKGVAAGDYFDDAIDAFGTDYDTEDVSSPVGDEFKVFKYKNGVVLTVLLSENVVDEDEDVVAELGIVRSIELKDNCTLKTKRGISIDSTRKDILDAYPLNSILYNGTDTVTVGFPGDEDTYSPQGRISFKMNGDKVVAIEYTNVYSE